MVSNSIPIRSDPSFANEMKEIKTARIQKGKDSALKPTRNSRITLAMTRHPLFHKMKIDIVNADLT